MLFYESSKCFHGRPENFNGSWYSSIFVHYRPSSVEWTSRDAKLEGHYGVPPGKYVCFQCVDRPVKKKKKTEKKQPFWTFASTSLLFAFCLSLLALSTWGTV